MVTYRNLRRAAMLIGEKASDDLGKGEKGDAMESFPNPVPARIIGKTEDGHMIVEYAGTLYRASVSGIGKIMSIKVLRGVPVSAKALLTRSHLEIIFQKMLEE